VVKEMSHFSATSLSAKISEICGQKISPADFTDFRGSFSEHITKYFELNF